MNKGLIQRPHEKGLLDWRSVGDPRGRSGERTGGGATKGAGTR